MNEIPHRRPRVAVIGPGHASPEELQRAEEVGRLLAERGAVVVCGGLGGCMEAVARGAASAGGSTIGFLPTYEDVWANDYVDLPLPTGLGEARNVLVVAAGQAVIAIGGGPGTLSEIALALKLGRRVVGLDTWTMSDAAGREAEVLRAQDAREAVSLALAAPVSE
jgi:hypothetical protein